MDRNSVTWAGAMPAITTPFDGDGRIDERALAASIERHLALGVTGIVAGGCTGEFWALTQAERGRLFEVAKDVIGSRATLIAGTGSIGIDDTVALTRHAEKIGCDGALILPPYFVKLTDDEIFAHYADVTARIGLPVMLYNIPGNAVNYLTPALVARLGELERVVAVKESSGDWNNFYGTFLAVHRDLRVFCGPSSVFGVPAVQLGADGVIDCFPNVWDAGGQALFDAARQGDTLKAAALQATGRRLTDLFTSGGRTLYPSTKAAMDLLGIPGGGTPRTPLRALGGAQRDALAAGLRAEGLL
ncbi:dihydrodipicolinate synthase family protein [Paraburkholderia caballeronis]|uniref:dihydrodipicolinate synthase family protein n=1 Tax=Paraburkholderia caballeronis TaxID=416943 RepID=UPI001064DE08|nr:dihydrodipicolinate synthase family protein [Paraburkholderia caballeronis]TDV15667.1 4-hydroxy-tetrahydrodipicolinate synthase [Paraburkholderia caballeronis]TDV17922.1 4-hydroxy-tetrahydrodipicolinate synthase [Paraburkholderia caballeronis]TDV26464.1 4-hydroxy-tetrahydrodipicolinate synthase [Paraburkholderia caballeronis]TDV33620.1 4-hydroxy-tetrahydrodipicolinate synthase [Paraburkholderia caballeronis]